MDLGMRGVTSGGASHFVWLTGGGARRSACCMIVGLLVADPRQRPRAIFWPRRGRAADARRTARSVLGEVHEREAIPDPARRAPTADQRIQLKVGNRDLYGARLPLGRRERRSPARRRRRRRLRSSGASGATSIGTRGEAARGRRRCWPAAQTRSGRARRRCVARRPRGPATAIRALETGEIGDVNYAHRAARGSSGASSTTSARQDPARDDAPTRRALDEREPSSAAGAVRRARAAARQAMRAGGA